jgi:cellulose synthase/poly-beta-1,6-N-acetylglucosamine synthase-like glycosyltransferase/exo-beta-1,3-glucanase (GH17 family)
MRVAGFVVAVAACLHVALWVGMREQTAAPDHSGPLTSVSFAPYHGTKHPDKGNRPTPAQIRSDLQIIAPQTRAIRTYSSTGGGELVPGIASEFGLKVTAGAWLDNDPKRNERELRAVVDLARKHRNINAVVVGNEAIYRGETVSLGDDPVDAEELKKIQAIPNQDERLKKLENFNVARLIKVIHRVKREVQVPVTTGEIWSVWRDHPELVSAVDFIAVHILPYWEGQFASKAVEEAVNGYNELRQRYPGKRIVIAEFGWPSAGYNRRNAIPGRLQQAEVLRDFVSRADALGIDYNIVEATDQPWKVFEGSVGPYWGMWDSSRRAKFAWSGPILDPEHWKTAGIAVLIGFLLSLPLLAMAGATVGQAALLALAAHAVGGWVATVFAYWNGHYFVPGAAFALGAGLLLLIPLVMIAMSRIEEIASIAFGRRQRKLVGGAPTAAGYTPKVSIHIPAYREPPEMLKQTLDALARLDYPDWEAIVIINNTPDPAFWMPIEEHCRMLGDRFKFINAEKVEGYKAGALRLALTQTHPDAQIIGVIDADYAVHPDWLKDLVPTFADARVGLVQAPQDHRDGSRSLMHNAMNGEYAGFFDIGMVERNENNAIVVHGTMCLIRRAALDAAGSWPADTICEDTDLGLTILEQGWIAHYTNRRYGHGLLPDTFEQYKKQRHRWAYGGFHIVKKHWRRFLPGASLLSRDQRRQYALGWLNWMGAESIGVVVAILNLLWVPVVAFIGIAIPDKILTLPIIAAFAVTLAHFITLYRLRVAIGAPQALASAFAAMSLQWTVAKAMWDGVVKDRLPFAVTAKGGRGSVQSFQAFWEAILGGLLVLGAATLIATNKQQVREIDIFAVVLMIQSLPFLAAVAMATLEGSRFNEFAYWTNLKVRLAEARLAMPRMFKLRLGRAPVSVSVSVPAENRVETVS